ncbi:MAG: hypothetical protein QNK16_07435 [Woeseiaceae bacterium]|nr:hypothetical protein [Woeseiaceae bacterium]MDX2608197.1 hypothetical protein [Woeseiaceae bacterium]
MRAPLLALLMTVVGFAAWAEEPDEQPADENETVAEAAAEEPVTKENQGDGIKSPKTMSGMSILGNEEAPKSLVIVPWKSSRMGDELDLSDTLDDRAQPVDKEVFMRELHFYQIRSDEQT